MAGVLDEYDEATPLKATYCSRLSVEDYEDQSSKCTGDALEQLIKHLENNPDIYKKVLKAKKKEDEETGFISSMRAKLWSYLSGGKTQSVVSDAECAEKVDNLKRNILKVYNYSQESKGRRFSKRLAEKRLWKDEQETTSTPLKYMENIPPPPPSLPSTPRTFSIPSYYTTPIVHATLTRRPLTHKQVKMSDNSNGCGKTDSIADLLTQLNGSEGKRRLKCTAMRSPGGTPLEGGWPKRRTDPNLLPYFNTKLLNKFKNTQQSPIPSPSLHLSSPGSFETPPPLSKTVSSSEDEVCMLNDCENSAGSSDGMEDKTDSRV